MEYEPLSNMPACNICGGPIVRTPRNSFSRVVNRATYKCERCGVRMRRRRSFFTLFNRYCECPKCGTRELTRLASRDHIDAMSPNPFRRLLILFGCSIYHCTFCRFQFRDWRERESDARKRSSGTKSKATFA